MTSNLDRFTQIPRRFHDALERDEINHRQFFLGCYLAGKVDYQTGEVAFTLRALADNMGWDWTDETLRKDLRHLRPGWIDYSAKQGQRSPYIFRLTGLQVGAHFQPRVRPTLEVSSNEADTASPATPPQQRDVAPAQPPTGSTPYNRTERNKRPETSPCSERDYDQGVGKTTATDPAVTDRLLERLHGLPSKTGAGPGGASSNGARPPHVDVADHSGPLWSTEARDGEQGVLDDLQALVDAGLAEWVDS
jgi:hypothetical protein